MDEILIKQHPLSQLCLCLQRASFFKLDTNRFIRQTFVTQDETSVMKVPYEFWKTSISYLCSWLGGNLLIRRLTWLDQHWIIHVAWITALLCTKHTVEFKALVFITFTEFSRRPFPERLIEELLESIRNSSSWSFTWRAPSRTFCDNQSFLEVIYFIHLWQKKWPCINGGRAGLPAQSRKQMLSSRKILALA